MKVRRIVLALALLWGAVSSTQLYAAEELNLFDSPVPLALEADQISFDRTTQTYEARGNVHLQRGTMTLAADRFWWNTTTGDAGAEGKVKLFEAGGSALEGDRLQLNLNTGTVRMENAYAAVQEQGFQLSGRVIERVADKSFHLSDGSFTTCAGEPPAWKFGASDMQVDLGRYARARHMKFYLYDVPVFYFPYMLYPVKSERESGFLLPQVGYSDQRGAQLSLVYYQVIARNQDATLYLDYLSSLGLGKGVDYRYLFGDENEGLLHGYHVTSFTGDENTYALGWRHNGLLPGKVRLGADTLYVSDRNFFDDFGENAAEYNRAIIESTLLVARNWDKNNLGAQFRYVQDLETSNDDTLQRLPELRYATVRQRIADTPFYYRLDLEADNYWRKVGDQGQRFMLRPALAVVENIGNAITLEAESGYREYYLSVPGEDQRRGLVDFSARATAPFERIYRNSTGDGSRLKHTITPEVSYSFIPDNDQEQLPVFEPESVAAAENLIGYGLVNRFVSRERDEQGEILYRELLRLRLYQNYDLQEARRSGSSRQPFSPFYADLRLAPTRYTNFEATVGYDFDGGREGLADVRALGSLAVGGNELSFDYNYRDGLVNYLAGTVTTELLKPVYLSYRNRIDLEAGTQLEQVFAVEFRHQCWSLILTYKDRLADQEFMVNFAFSGLGRATGLGSSQKGRGE
jgi:LPS-assembly protein